MDRADVLKKAYGPVLKKPKLVANHILYGLFGGLSMIFSVYVLQLVSSYIEATSLGIEKLILTIIGIVLIWASFNLIEIYIYHKSYTEFTFFRMELFIDILSKSLNMDFKYYEDPVFFAGLDAILEGVSSNNLGIEGVYHKLFEISKYLVASIILAIVLMKVSPLIILLTLTTVLIESRLSKKIVGFSFDKKDDISKVSRKLGYYNTISSDFSYGKDIRMYNPLYLFDKYRKIELDNLKEIYKGISRRERPLILLQMLFASLGEGISIMLLIFIYGKGLTIPDIVMYITALILLNNILSEVIRSLENISENLMYTRATFEFLDKNLKTEGGKSIDFKGKPVEIEFENVSFSYPNTDKKVFENLNFKIDKEDTLAVVGLNGAGKTSFIKLLMGLYNPDEGRILYNGVDGREISLESKYKIFAPVFQDINPLAFTVAENIGVSLKGGDINRERVIDKLKEVGLWDKISSSYGGIDSMMFKNIDPKGLILSGGENQKLLIARALYKEETSVLILDEPTSSLDALAEEKIYREMENISREKTTIFISHRLASTKFCNKILLINGGRVEEYGNHKELMELAGLYKDMYETQGKYYKEDN